MKDEKKTKAQLIEKLLQLREQVANFQKAGTKPKQALEALRASEARFRALTESTSDWIWEVDENAAYTYASPKVKELLGYEPEEIIGRTPFDLMPPEEAKSVLAEFGRVIEARKTFHRLENTNMHKDGHLVILETSGVPIFDLAGNFRGYRGIDRDITERKKAEEVIKRRLEFERTIAAISSRFAGTEDIDKAVNESLGDVGRLSGAGRVYIFLINQEGTMDNTHEWCAEGVSPQIDNLQDLPLDMVPWWMRKLRNGETIHIRDVSKLPQEAATEKEILESQDIKSLLVLPLYLEEELGGFVGFDNVAETGSWSEESLMLLRVASEILGNALERKKAEEALQESEEKLKAVFDNMTDGVLLVDAESRKFLMANKAICEMLDYSLDEIENLGVADIHSEKDLPHVTEQFEKLARGEIKQAADLPVKRKDGSVFYADVNSSPIKLGEKMYLLGVFRDITQRREAEEARRKIEAQKLVVEKLKELNRIKDEFVETVTHELRTPMTPLRSSVDLLLDGSLGDLAPQQKKYLEMMKRNIDRLSRFATEVLTFSKLESGSYKLHPREISVLSVVRTVTDLLKRKTTETDTSIGVEVRAESFAYADPDAVSEVITNLLANAIVHNPAGTHVRVSSRPVDEHFVEVSIADNGKGIPEDMLDRIFEKFFQAGRECGPGYRGTGIGLTVCKTLVEKMGGTISVQSRVSEGSIFKFTLPMKNPG